METGLKLIIFGIICMFIAMALNLYLTLNKAELNKQTPSTCEVELFRTKMD